jgi:hypothetical protein
VSALDARPALAITVDFRLLGFVDLVAIGESLLHLDSLGTREGRARHRGAEETRTTTWTAAARTTRTAGSEVWALCNERHSAEQRGCGKREQLNHKLGFLSNQPAAFRSSKTGYMTI